MSTFRVGEVCIYVRPGSPYFGEEVVVCSPLSLFDEMFDHITGEWITSREGYRVSGMLPDIGDTLIAPPEWLRKKPQRRDIDQKVSWSELHKLGWVPGVVA